METDRNSQSLLCFLLGAPIMADRLSERAMHTGWVRFFKGVWNGLFFCYNNRLCHKLAHHCLSICLINYCSIDGSRMATCRIMERFGFEPWSGAALRCVLGQVTSISQCLSPPRYYVYKWIPANMDAGGNCMECKEAICSTKCDTCTHWKTHDCNGKRTCLKRISTSFVFLAKIIEEETSVSIILLVG